MLDIKAIFLAAGRGVRMGERGRMTPKGLISIGERTFLEEAVATLADNGVGNARVVTGHLAEQYRDLAAVRCPGLDLRHNPDFEVKGSLQSLLVGLEGEDGPCLLLESDLIFEPRAVATAIARPDRSALLVSGATGAGDEVHVWADETDGNRCLRDMSKLVDRWPDAPHGELVGITYLTGDAIRHLRRIGPDLVRNNAMEDYENGLVELARSHPVTCPKVEDLAWAEVDNEAMLTRAAKQVYPRILAARAR